MLNNSIDQFLFLTVTRVLHAFNLIPLIDKFHKENDISFFVALNILGNATICIMNSLITHKSMLSPYVMMIYVMWYLYN